MAQVLYIYWTDSAQDAIFRVDGDGGNEVTILSGLNNPNAIAVDNDGGKIYYSELGANNISRCNLDGTGIEELITGEDSCREISLDLIGGKLYYASVGATDLRIGRSNLDGSSLEELVGSIRPYGLGLDVANNWMYWTDNLPEPDKISKAHLDGTSVADVIASAPWPAELSVDTTTQKIYWTDWPSESSIRRANVDGSGEEILITSVTDGFVCINLDEPEGKMYFNRWVGASTVDIRSANLDGTGETTLVSKSQASFAIDGIALAYGDEEPAAPRGRWDKNVYPLARTTRRAR